MKTQINPVLFAIATVFIYAPPPVASAAHLGDFPCSHSTESDIQEQQFAVATASRTATSTPSPSFDFSADTSLPFLTVRPGQTKNYTPAMQAKLEKAIRLMEVVLNSKALHDKIDAFTYKNKQQFSDNRGQTNEQIYDSIRETNEGGTQNGIDYTADFNHRLYYKRFTKVVGYTYFGDTWINSNTKYVNGYDEADLAGHLSHEWTHLMGYQHVQTFPYSVPYAVGEMVAELAHALIAQGF